MNTTLLLWALLGLTNAIGILDFRFRISDLDRSLISGRSQNLKSQVQNPKSIKSVSLTLQTRGVRKEIRVDARQMRITVNDRVTTRPTPTRHWKRLTGLLSRMNLSDLPTLPASTRRSATDAALAAHIVVVTTGKTYESSTYDHPDPPTAMVPLVKTLIDGMPTGVRGEFR